MRIRRTGAVLAAIMLIVVLLMSSLAIAKGVVRTEPNSEESRQAPEVQQPPPPPPPPSSENHRDDSTSTRSDSAPVLRNEERRDDSISNDQPSYSTPEQRGPGTPDVGGQILKRDERRDPDYEYRRHYSDTFFYPYDSIFYRNYPYYDRGAVIIIDRDTWNDRHRWRGDYEYSNPSPGSLEEALVDIEATWREGNPEFLMWHVDHLGKVDVYYDGKYSHTLSPREIFKLTDEAIGRVRTIDFHFTSVDRHGHSARVKATHEYDGPDGRYRTAYLVYYLEKVRDRWVIDRLDIRKSPYGSPRCFIATAAYGTPMEKEVLVLRQFRDEYLLTNLPGRVLVRAYYRISPAIARSIEHSPRARALVRGLLRPVVQICEAVVPNAGE